MLGSSVVSFILFIKFGIMLGGKICLMANLHFFPMLLLFFVVKGTLASDTSLSKVVYPVIYSILLEVRRMESLSNFAFPHSCILFFFFFFCVLEEAQTLRVVNTGLTDRSY